MLIDVVCLLAATSFGWNGIFQDDMVLQCDRNVRVWGESEPGSTVKIRFGGQTVVSQTDDDGFWCATLAPLAATREGRVLEATCGDSRLQAKNVVVGEVWLCSGQSNMEQPLWSGGWGEGWSDANGVIESKLTKYPDIRAFKSKNRESPEPLEETVGKWNALTDEGVLRQTYAIPFYFARVLLRARPEVPVGLIQAAWGGRSIQPFIPAEGYAIKDPRDVEERTVGSIYNAVVHPLRRFALRGTLWYQGENNMAVGDTPLYKNYMHALAGGWRQAFGDPSMPFYISEIAPYSWGTEGMVAAFQREQRQFAHEDANAACIVINDCGDPDTVHPDRKENVGLRYALVALNRLYGRKDLACDAPEPISAFSAEGVVTVTFTNTVQLGVNSCPVYAEHRVRGFELAGADGCWTNAVNVEIIGNKIRASSPSVARPKKIRYLWRNSEAGTLYAGDTNLRVGSFELAAPVTEGNPGTNDTVE